MNNIDSVTRLLDCNNKLSCEVGSMIEFSGNCSLSIGEVTISIHNFTINSKCDNKGLFIFLLKCPG